MTAPTTDLPERCPDCNRTACLYDQGRRKRHAVLPGWLHDCERHALKHWRERALAAEAAHRVVAAIRHAHAISQAGGRVSLSADHGEITVYIGYRGDHVHHGRYGDDNRFDLDATIESAAETILGLPVEAHEWPDPPPAIPTEDDLREWLYGKYDRVCSALEETGERRIDSLVAIIRDAIAAT